MASRITKQQGLYDPTDKLQSNTLKRHPKMDLNKTDLLRLLSYLEGELQARDIVIATLKAEKAKQLLYQAKYGRFGLGDPFMALQRDSDNMKDNSFDESAIKSMYDNQLAQLENLIATQRKAQLKMRDQLATAEKRYHKVCNELEDEKRKHAQDTAQGDDVTYMLEKERERLRQEIEYEKSQNKKMEKDLKKTLTSLEEERANSIKHKQVAVMLIKEQKKLIEKLVKDRQKINKYEQLLQDEKSKTTNVVEGLVQESKKSLKMEAAMEKQLSDFDTEREQLKNRLSKEEYKNKDLTSQIESLHQQIDLLHKQLMIEKTGSKDAFQSIEIKSTASPSKMDVRDSTTERVISGMSPHVPKPSKIAESSIRLVDTPDRIRVPGTEGLVQKTVRYTNTKSPDRLGGTSEGYRVESPELRIAPVGAVSGDKASNEVYRGGTRIGMQAGGKILTVNVSHPNPPSSPSNLSPRKVAQTGRGTPPPLPPNKPVLASCSSPVNIKPAPPPKASTVPSKDHSHISSQEMSSPGKAVHIPVSVVHSSGAVIGSNRTSGGTDNKSSPIRKPTQWMPGVSDDHNNSHTSAATTDAVTSSQSHDTLDFLGPEMADLQNLLTSIISDSDNTDSVEVSSSSSSSSSLAALPVSSSSSSSGVSADPLLSQIHRLAAEGNLSALQQLIIQREADVNLPLKDGSTPLLYAAKNGHFECVEFLLERGANPETSGDNKFSPLHAAALEGHQSCVKLLLEKDVNPNIGDYFNWTPLHLAASRGHTDCCRLLLDNGAKLSALSNTSCTPLHSAVQADQVSCLDFLLRYHSQLSSLTPGHVTTQELVAVEDSGGRTVWHNAVMKNTTDCLETILNICSVDVMGADRWGRSLLDVATPECNQLLFQSGGNKTLIIPVHLEIRHPNIAPKGNNSAEITSQSYIIGSTQVSAATSWNDMECSVQNLLISYFNHLDMGLKTKRTSRLDPEMISESVQYTLGLGLKSIDTLTIGSFHWKIGSQRTDTVPHTILSNSYLKQISIVIEGSIESIACDVLFPVSVLQNYLRLLEHYKSVVFYGPEGTGKSYLAHRIAHFVAKKEQHSGKTAKVRQVTLDEQFCHQDLVQLLIEEGCMVTEENDDSDSRAPILILDGLEKVNMAEMFGKLLNAVEHRGQHHSFVLEGHSLQKYFFVDSFYIIATMNKARSTGLDLSIQQRFRWVHFRIDIEPIRNFLARHFLRKFIHSCKGLLPITDTSIFRAVEWIVCVWQRLNDGLGKLGLPDVIFGPYQFLSCPLETNNDSAVHKWLSDMWNSKIAPAVRESVVKGTGKETTADGQQKVANTALYVLMQKAVVPGCPLSGQEKDKYLSTFSGSNELEIPIRAEKSKATVSNGHHHSRRSTGSTKLTPRARNRNSLDLEGQRENTPISALSIKRRSLSETSIKNSVEYEDKNMAGDSSVSAKVPKLEIRTPAIFSLSRDTRSSSPLSGYTSDTGETIGHIKPLSFSSASKRSSLSSSVDSTQSPQSRGVSRRSKSSESLLDSSPEGTDGGFGSKQKSSSPFSFSLTTPTSSLSSFKFLEVKSRSVSGSGRSGLRRSLNSLDQDYFRESESRRSLTKIPVRMSSDGETNPSLFQRFDDLDKQSSESLFANIKNLGKYASENPFLQESENKKSIDSSELSKKQSDNLFGRSLDARQTLDKVLADFSHSNASWNAAKRKSDYSPTQKSGSSRGLEESNQNQSSHMASSTNQQFVKETTVNRNYGRKRNSVESNC